MLEDKFWNFDETLRIGLYLADGEMDELLVRDAHLGILTAAIDYCLAQRAAFASEEPGIDFLKSHHAAVKAERERIQAIRAGTWVEPEPFSDGEIDADIERDRRETAP